MKWSYRVGQWFGIGVYIHLTFGLLLGWVALSSLAATGSVAATLLSVVFVVALFGFVVLHEYGHALTARHFGIRTRDITLYPIGGVAALERMPDSPRQQALIAIAGPAVNFVLAGTLATIGWLFGLDPLESWGTSQAAGPLSELLSLLVTANLVLGSFNLLPALPMDGGRLFKALLSIRMDAQRATAIAARVARVVAVAMALYGLFGEPGRPMLVAIAAFVWFTAAAEARLASGRAQAARVNAWPTDRYRTTPGMRRDGYLDGYPVERSDVDRFWPADRQSVAEVGEVNEVIDAPYGGDQQLPRRARGGVARTPRFVRFVVVRGRFGPVLRVRVEEP